MSPNSSAWPCKANRMIKSYGAGDGNRTHVRSLGSLQFNSKTAGLAAFFRFSERLNWEIMENEIGCGEPQPNCRESTAPTQTKPASSESSVGQVGQFRAP